MKLVVNTLTSVNQSGKQKQSELLANITGFNKKMIKHVVEMCKSKKEDVSLAHAQKMKGDLEINQKMSTKNKHKNIFNGNHGCPSSQQSIMKPLQPSAD